MNAFNEAVKEYSYMGYSNCENSTRVFTIKVKDRKKSRIVHSCDFAIVNKYGKNEQYIRFNKEQNTYTWEQQTKGYLNLPKKISSLKANGLWNEVRELYLYKKNNNIDKNKKSRSLRAESINEVYSKFFR